ncbi:Putative rRNA methylase [Mariprofundus aestuarium]|uniref:rRNA methylase n=1 Tax=Mariprofundus aestuarium TaxID=1921086 RepID=A0A2K8L780_MARES|nr:class I SAM-dependent methyltransferase [Mariprofundus aestuarium]ATX80126.1 Putative rRNA methylase [Mariprofundus aestuarium]
MARVSLTGQVHKSLLARIKDGATCIDATAGNGFDTLFLASHTGEAGHTYAFDIQQQAIDNTKKRLAEADLLDRVTLIHAGHESMLEHVPETDHGKVDIIVFNLGYLPRTDKSVITHEPTTLQALNSSLKLLSSRGHISILAYPGHPGGREEAEAVKTWAKHLPATFDARIHEPENSGGSSPEWIEINAIAK